MTLQTRQFLELPDITALRFDCVHCHATVSVPLSGRVDASRFRQCPMCRQPWLATMEGASMEVALTNLVDALKRMSELIYGEVKFPSGCTLQLEIKQGASALWPHLPEK